jgi:Tol biopolymer transport system component
VPNNGLQYVVLGSDRRVLIEPQPEPDEARGSYSIGWSSDSRKIVFSRRGKVVTLEIGTGKRNEIADGTNPAWSPDGRWISFTSLEHHPMLINPSTLARVPLYGGRTITGPIAWSPDSCCISFSDMGGGLDTFYQASGRMIVYRINDGQSFPAMHFGLGGYSNNFGWLYDYKRFLEFNQANRAKWVP